MPRLSILSSPKLKSLISILLIIAFACETPNKETINEDPNPAAEGFNLSDSDSLAIAWADATMSAMGGRSKWDNTRFISWDFFGRRTLLWDKFSGDVRIESPFDSTVYLINIHSDSGQVRIKNRVLQDADSIADLVTRGKRIWINDSYWLTMPFKLKDSGVTLKYLGENAIQNGELAHVLELTFENVGFTPYNKYEVYITKSDSLVKQWAYYGRADQDSASAIWPWDNYQDYNGLLLSADRSDGLGPGNVQVFDNIPDKAFTDFDWKINP